MPLQCTAPLKEDRRVGQAITPHRHRDPWLVSGDPIGDIPDNVAAAGNHRDRPRRRVIGYFDGDIDWSGAVP